MGMRSKYRLKSSHQLQVLRPNLICTLGCGSGPLWYWQSGESATCSSRVRVCPQVTPQPGDTGANPQVRDPAMTAQITPYTSPGGMQGFVRTLLASLSQTAVHLLVGTQHLPGCTRLSHQAKWFLKLLGSLPSTTHLLPRREVLIAQLPPGENNDCATGHAEPVGL